MPHDSMPPPPQGERRRLCRRELWETGIATPIKSRPFDVRILNASDEGVGFLAPQLLAVGQEISLSLLTIDLRGHVLRCRVVHCLPQGKAFYEGAAIIKDATCDNG